MRAREPVAVARLWRLEQVLGRALVPELVKASDRELELVLGRECRDVPRERCSRRALEPVEAVEQARDEVLEPRGAWKEAASRHRGPR